MSTISFCDYLMHKIENFIVYRNDILLALETALDSTVTFK